MTRKGDIERVIEAADPVDPTSIARLPLEEAKHELLAGIVAEPRECPSPVGGANMGRAPRRWRPRRSRAAYLALGVAASVACALVLVVTGTVVGPTGSPAPAFGAVLTRLVKASPHILMRLPGWEMQLAKQTSATEGTIEFAADDRSKRVFLEGRLRIETQSIARLEWRALEQGDRIGPLKESTFVGTVPVLGVTARVYASDASDVELSPDLGFRAAWNQSDRRMELFSSAPDLGSFARRLSALRFVGRAAWLGAVPSRLRLINGRAIAGRPLAEQSIALSCGNPLSPALAAREKRSLATFFNRHCRGN